MTTSELISQAPTSGVTSPPSPTGQRVELRASEPSASGDLGALLGVVAVAGPPVLLIAGGAMLFGLMLTGAFVLFAALVIVPFVAAATVFALAGAAFVITRWVIQSLRGRLPTTAAPPVRLTRAQLRHA